MVASGSGQSALGQAHHPSLGSRRRFVIQGIGAGLLVLAEAADFDRDVRALPPPLTGPR
jgi:hypothetical protein